VAINKTLLYDKIRVALSEIYKTGAKYLPRVSKRLKIEIKKIASHSL